MASAVMATMAGGGFDQQADRGTIKKINHPADILCESKPPFPSVLNGSLAYFNFLRKPVSGLQTLAEHSRNAVDGLAIVPPPVDHLAQQRLGNRPFR